MGRQLKRVALDFNWPLGKTWEGFVNPHGKVCPDCPEGVAHNERLTPAEWEIESGHRQKGCLYPDTCGGTCYTCTLIWCRLCGQAESELAEKCPKAGAPRPASGTIPA